MGHVRADHHQGPVTGGGYSLHEGILEPGQGLPLHTHTREDETMYLLSGELDVTLGDKQFKAKAGDFVHMARDVPTGSRMSATSRLTW